MQAENLDKDARFAHPDFKGTALRFSSYIQVWEPWLTIELDEDGNEVELETSEGEWIAAPWADEVRVIMVGDDHEYVVSVEDLEELDDEEYCSECGQVGCGWS